jgi:amidase
MAGWTSEEPKQADRRRFLKSGIAAAAGLAVLPEWLLAQARSPGTSTVTVMDEISLDTMRKGLNSGQIIAHDLTQYYLSRIDTIDRTGPGLNSVIETNPDALAIAGDLDRERQTKGPRGPLHGIPILIKDNIATADRMQTTAGSLALVGSRPPKDAFVVSRLRAAGAVVLGKTNCSEWANFRGRHSTSGWSGRGGQTRNPYALDRNPSGSSSGSGAAAAANLCAVAVGTETDGSIVSPSSINGLAGIKPTVGLVSRSGIIPISHTQDTAGPMARTLADAATLLSVLAGVDADDPATEAARSHVQADYTRFLDPNGLRGSRLGVVRKYAGFNMHVDRVFEEALAALKAAGAEVIDPVEIASIDKLDEPETEVLHFEFKADLNRYLAWLGASSPVHSLEEIIAFNQKNRPRELAWFGQESMEKAQKKGDLTSPEYQKAIADCRRLSRQEGIDAAMDKFRLDALIAPTDGPAWPTDPINGDHFSAGTSTLAAVAGYPHVTVPMGFVFGLPVGISFFSRAWSEPTLIKLAYSYEQSTRVRKPPGFRATVEVREWDRGLGFSSLPKPSETH